MNNYYELTPDYKLDTEYGNIYSETCNLFDNKNKSVNIIREELSSILNKEFDFELKELDELESVKKLIVNYKCIQNEFFELSNELNKETQNTDNDIELLNSHIKYINNIYKKYEDRITPEIETTINSMSNILKENNKLLEVRKKYEESRKKILPYLSFIKYINNFNTGCTCSLCLSNNVNSYFDPCGHTSCSECIKSMKVEFGKTSCPFCKMKINITKPLYFL